MSRTALVVVGILALTLGAIFYITSTRPRGTGATPSGATSPLDRSSTRDASLTITIEAPGKPRGILHEPPARAQGAHWTLESAGVRWPVASDKPSTLLRLLNEATAAPEGQPKAEPRNAIVLTIEDGSQTQTVKVADTALAGRVPLSSSNGFVGVAPARLLDLLIDPGPESWRLTTPFPALEPTAASRLVIAAGDRTIELARIDRRWRVIRPVAARANPLVVEEALARVETYRIGRFFSPPDATGPGATAAPADIGVDPPTLTLTLSSGDERGVLGVGAPLPNATSWYATTRPPGASADSAPVVVQLTGPAPTSFSTAVRNYLATTATDVLPADVGAIRLSPTEAGDAGADRRFKRSLDAWNLAHAGSEAETPADAARITAALAFLHDEPAEPQESFAEDDVRALLRVELLNFGDEPLDVLSVGYNADGLLAVRGRNVVWLYPSSHAPDLFELPSFGDLPPRVDVADQPPPALDHAYPSK